MPIENINIPYMLYVVYKIESHYSTKPKAQMDELEPRPDFLVGIRTIFECCKHERVINNCGTYIYVVLVYAIQPA